MRFFLYVSILLTSSFILLGQGLSFSYLIPTNGDLSAPVSPFSIRGVGVQIGKSLSIETGFSLYSLPGLSITGIPLASNEPLRGQHFGLLIPVALSGKIDLKTFKIILSAGGFALFHSNARLIEGNWDRSIIKMEQWDVATSELVMKNRIGYGWLFGTALEIPVNRQMSITTGVNYLAGFSASPVSGVYAGGRLGEEITQKTIKYDNAKTQIQGFELMIGVTLSK